MSSPEVGANVGDLFSNAKLRTRKHKILMVKSFVLRSIISLRI
jgi:hypothetical protein